MDRHGYPPETQRLTREQIEQITSDFYRRSGNNPDWAVYTHINDIAASLSPSARFPTWGYVFAPEWVSDLAAWVCRKARG